MNPFLVNVQRLGPIILAAWPATVKLAPLVVQAILEAEALAGASGADKKRHALQLVDLGIAMANSISPEPQIDPAFARDVASIAIDALVATCNIWSKTAIGS